MSDSQALLHRITALRQQLQQARRLGDGAEPGPAAAKGADPATRLRRLEHQVAAGAEHAALLDTTLRPLAAGPTAPEAAALPKRLTARARRLLEQGRGLLEQLRTLADTLPEIPGDGAPSDSLAAASQQATAMADTVLRLIGAFPDAPSAQLRLCDGLEPLLEIVAERVAELTAAEGQRRREGAEVETLAGLLTELHAGRPVSIDAFVQLAEPLLAEAREGAALRFLAAGPEQPARFVACHSLTVARVMARVVRGDADWRREPLEPILAALLHDAGMLGVPADVLAQPGPLDDAQRRAVETHTLRGGDLMTRLLPTGAWLAEAAAGHHERQDGTGYPAGRRDGQIAPLARLLAVCDVYAALGTPRPQRPALDTRTALTDTLLLAEQGLLDRTQAERLLHLTFYPVGSVVELADGALGVVVATHLGRRDLNTPARPVLALLTDSQGRPLPGPRHVDLAACESRSVVRALPREERRQRLGRRYPELG